MDRRNFIKTAGTLVAGATLTSSALGQPAEVDHARAGFGRTVLPLNRNWRWSPKVVDAAHRRDFDDNAWDKVVVPHTNKRLPWHSFEDKEYEFVSMYRRRFKLPPALHTLPAGFRVFVDFEGVMTASSVWINGQPLGEYRGGYTPFSFELTRYLDPGGENLLAVTVDSTERADIPPFGNEVDYLTFGGLYREVALRIVPATFIENIFAQPKDVLTEDRSLDVQCFLDRSSAAGSQGPLTLEAELRDGERVLSKAAQRVPTLLAAAAEPAGYTVSLTKLGPVKLWRLHEPQLYTVHVRLLEAGRVIDSDTRRVGFREATFTDHGFSLNGEIIKLRGLDRHQTFPFAGQAMPARVQRRDASILKQNLKCNIVRTSHYPQSRHFLDACDDIGLLVLEEIPGWQHIGDRSWQDISVDNVRRMIRRDWNHPAIVLWGVRINESHDDHDFYTRTNTMAHSLDPSRQTGGIRNFQESEFLEDVFTMNDFGFPLKPPVHGKYLNTEFVGHTFPTKTIDSYERLREHAHRHARVHDQLASDPRYAGGIGWCAFDYDTHANFGSGDRICYHGVADIFREPKPAAGFYKSQCDPKEEVVLEPAFHWARNDESVGFTVAMVSSNCDHLKFSIDSGQGFRQIAEGYPDRSTYPHLRYPPFNMPIGEHLNPWGDLRIDGFIGGRQVISKSYSGKGTDQQFALLPDDKELIADGADTTRVVIRVNDEYGQVRPFANDPIVFEIEGPAEIIGDNPFSLVGGTGAIWIRARETAGRVTLRGTHPRLGRQEVTLTLTEAQPEAA